MPQTFVLCEVLKKLPLLQEIEIEIGSTPIIPDGIIIDERYNFDVLDG